MTDQILQLMKELHDKYKTLDPFQLVEMLDIEIRYESFLEKPKGLYSKLLDDPVIILSESVRYTNERYFVLAHELHHAVAHDEISSYYASSSKSRNKIEYEANNFGVAICLFLYMQEHSDESLTIDNLRAYYGVPTDLSETMLG